MAEMASLERTADVLLEHRARQASRSEFLSDKQQAIERGLRDQSFRMRDTVFQLRRKRSELQGVAEDRGRKDRECAQHRLRLDAALTLVGHAQDDAAGQAQTTQLLLQQTCAIPVTAMRLLHRLQATTQGLRAQPQVLSKLREAAHRATCQFQLMRVSLLPSRLAGVVRGMESGVAFALASELETVTRCQQLAKQQYDETLLSLGAARGTAADLSNTLNLAAEKDQQLAHDVSALNHHLTTVSAACVAAAATLAEAQRAGHMQGGVVATLTEQVAGASSEVQSLLADTQRKCQALHACQAQLEAEAQNRTAAVAALRQQHSSAGGNLLPLLHINATDAVKAAVVAQAHAAVRQEVQALRQTETTAEDALKAQLSAERDLAGRLQRAMARHEAATALAAQVSMLERSESASRTELAEASARLLQRLCAAEQEERNCWIEVADDTEFIQRQEAQQRGALAVSFQRQLDVLVREQRAAADEAKREGRPTAPHSWRADATASNAAAKSRFKPAPRTERLHEPSQAHKRARDDGREERPPQERRDEMTQGQSSQSLGRVVLRQQHQSSTSDGSWSALGSPNHPPTPSADGVPPPSAAGTQIGRDNQPARRGLHPPAAPARTSSPPPKDPSRRRTKKGEAKETETRKASPAKPTAGVLTQLGGGMSTSSLTKAWLTAQSQGVSSQPPMSQRSPPAKPHPITPSHGHRPAAKGLKEVNKRRQQPGGSLFHVDSLY